MDYSSGIFVKRSKDESKKIKIEGQELFLVRNALRREGFSISQESSIVVNISNHNDMIVTTDTTSIKVESIKELINILNTL